MLYMVKMAAPNALQHEHKLTRELVGTEAGGSLSPSHRGMLVCRGRNEGCALALTFLLLVSLDETGSHHAAWLAWEQSCCQGLPPYPNLLPYWEAKSQIGARQASLKVPENHLPSRASQPESQMCHHTWL